MASSSIIEETCQSKMNVEAVSFSTFLTEDMLDAAMTNIQDMEDTDNEDGIFVDDETSLISSNGSLEADVSFKEDKGQNFAQKMDGSNLSQFDIVQDKNEISENLKKNILLDITSEKEIVREDAFLNCNTQVEEQLDLEKEIILSKAVIEQKDDKHIVIDLTKDNCVVINKEDEMNSEITLNKDTEIEIINEKGTNVEISLAKYINEQVIEKAIGMNTEITLIKDVGKQITDNENITNSEIFLVKDKVNQTETTEKIIGKDITLTEDMENNMSENKKINDILTKETSGKIDRLEGVNDKIITSIKEAFDKINTVREKRTIEKTSTIETENQIETAEVSDFAEPTEDQRREQEITLIKETNNKINTVISDASAKMAELTPATNIFNENIQQISVYDEENSPEQIDKDFEEMMNYEEISDDDDCGLEIDDNLEKEIENNLMAEIGLSPQAKKTCFVLDDPEIIDDTDDIVEVERREANKLDNESITLYRADDIETPDLSSMVECVLDNSNGDVTSPSSSEQLIPNTSYSGNSHMIIQNTLGNNESKQVKLIYMKSKKRPEVVKQLLPALNKTVNPNKNVQYVLKVNGNLSMDNIANKKLKMVPVQKSILAPLNTSSSNKIVIKDPTFDEIVLKNQIIESQLPPFVPSKLVTSSTVFCCGECQDTFMIESSLKHHITRRSVMITYWCRICCISMKFYNRCLMLKHIRLHKQSISNIDSSNIQLRPIEKDMLEIGMPKPVEQNWKENCINDIFSKYSATSSQVDMSGSISNRSKTLTSVVKIPRQNVNQFVPLSSSGPINTENITVLHGNKDTQSEEIQDSNKDVNIVDQNNSDKTVCSSFTTVNIDLSTTDLTNNESEFDTSINSQTVDTSPQIRIDEVYSMNLNHTNSNEEEINSVVAEIISDFKSLIGNKPEEKIPRISVKALPMVENDLPSDRKIISVSEKNGIRNKNNNTSGKGAKVKCLKDVKSDKYSYCSECGIKVAHMEKHLNRSNVPTTDQNLKCRVCRLILPTKCALKIHLRFHMKLPPYKCPECGQLFSLFQDLYPHIKYVCGHLSRLVKYICSKCKKPCSNLVQLESHIFSLHTNRVFKCSSCPVAFFNVISVKKHKTKDHPNIDIFPLTYQQCTLCPDKLIPKGNVSEHISEHARNPSQLAYVYLCPGCKKWFTKNKEGFVSHLAICIKVMKELQKFNQEPANGTKEPITVDLGNYSEESDSFAEEPTIIRKFPHLDEDIIEMFEKDPLSLEDWEGNTEHVREKRIEMCIVCKAEPVIILPGTDLNKQSLCCNLCVKPVKIQQNKEKPNQFKEKTSNFKSKMDKTRQEQMNIKSNTLKKYERKRSRRPIKRKMSLDFEYDTCDYSFVKTQSEKSESTCSSPENKKSPKNKLKFKKSKIDTSSEENGINFISGQIIPENNSDNLMCSKCGFKASNVDEFRNHVITHRTDPNAYQCLECGLCFVVQPSLEKHLIVLHRIKNVKEYIQNNNVGGEQLKEEEDMEIDSRYEEVEENQCRVCFMMFDSPTSLDKHFRTHGMAFLMSSQRQSKKL